MLNDIQSSDFIHINNISDIEMLDSCGSTSIAYKTRIDGRRYFMKRLRPEFRHDASYREAFFKEYNSGKEIKSPYVVEYIDIKEDNEGLYILMEYVNGTTIKEKVIDEPGYFHSKANIENMLLQLCKALKALHKENIVHLDINPSNVIISQVSNEVKLIDLGFCVSNYNDCTPGSTPGFGAPEAKLGNTKEIDARADIYSIGSLLQFIEEKTGASLPRRFEKIKKRCLQPQKEKRYQNIDEIITEIGHTTRRIGFITTITTLVLALMVPFATYLYDKVSNYIAWERGEVADKFQVNDMYYKITDNDARTVELTFKGNTPDEYQFEYGDGEVKIPAKIEYRGRKFRVTSIGHETFDNPETTSVILPDGVETIKDYAFFVCRLTKVAHIPKSVKDIGFCNYTGQFQIEGFVVDEENPVYDSRGGCNAIIETATNTLVAACNNSVIPNDVTTIGEHTYANYHKESFTIPNNITTLADGAFSSSRLTDIVIPDNVTSMGKFCFIACTALKSVTLPAHLAQIEEGTFTNCGLREILINDNIRNIGKNAFFECKNLRVATIGSNVREVGQQAFGNCTSLTKIVSRIPADSLQATGNDCFKGISKKCVLYVPRGAKSTYKNTFGWDYFDNIVEVDM